ncbi:uncharacterized protein PHALS_08476 [Plasmopara halstedii]|uniref:Uncharacterized protein n=1 Tax=Plasmopara halstedii TaxID=4781 RepID=A0A0P1ACY3_PLAHL|nr:uncharacterized protein PHALS_08476 [Plasmopara halstedii]CEG38398.1 hypothetical protein PHALS_08476 [Plasmopara halstedii]|eukprot:XP_024574767.1 hypothetical protein PHALS_08476 [Plasmopara halstedii]
MKTGDDNSRHERGIYASLMPSIGQVYMKRSYSLLSFHLFVRNYIGSKLSVRTLSMNNMLLICVERPGVSRVMAYVNYLNLGTTLLYLSRLVIKWMVVDNY